MLVYQMVAILAILKGSRMFPASSGAHGLLSLSLLSASSGEVWDALEDAWMGGSGWAAFKWHPLILWHPFSWGLGPQTILVGGLEHSLFFHTLGRIIPINWLFLFQRGWNHQPGYLILLDGFVCPNTSSVSWSFRKTLAESTGWFCNNCQFWSNPNFHTDTYTVYIYTHN